MLRRYKHPPYICKSPAGIWVGAVMAQCRLKRAKGQQVVATIPALAGVVAEGSSGAVAYAKLASILHRYYCFLEGAAPGPKKIGRIGAMMAEKSNAMEKEWR